MASSLSGSQFGPSTSGSAGSSMGSSGGFTLPTAPSMASQTATTSTPATTSGGTTFSPYKANALGNAISSTTGATDFRQAGQDFSRGGFSGIAGGIGHSIMGGINAASTAAMVVPGIGEGIKGLDIGLNAAVKGGDMLKSADSVGSVARISSDAGHLSGAGHVEQLDMFGGAAQRMSKPASNILPDSHTVTNPAQFKPSSTPQLYHGNNVAMKPGEVIRPGGATSQGTAFSTSEPKTAEMYAQDSMSGTRSLPGHAQQQSLFGVVHKVSPLDSSAVTNEGSSVFTSPKGFKVEGPSHLIDSVGNRTYLDGTKPNIPKPQIQKPSVNYPHPSGSNAHLYGRESGI